MELTDKILIENEKEAQNFINNWKCAKIYSSLSVKDFKKYPALLSYYEDDNDYSMNYSATAYYSISYLDDFEEYTGMNLDVAKIYAFIKKDMQNPYYDNADAERIHAYQDILKFIEENINKDKNN